MLDHDLKHVSQRGDLSWYATQSNSNRSHCELVRSTYSLPKILLSGFALGPDTFELEVSREISRRMNALPAGTFVPLNYFGRDLSATTAVSGGDLIQQRLSTSLLSVLRNQSVVLNLGGTLIEGLKAPITFPRQDTTAPPNWLGETTGVTPFSGVPAFDQVLSVPRRVSASIPFSKQLLVQSLVDGGIEDLVKRDITRSIAVAIDEAALDGLGAASNQPLGILNYPVGSGVYTAVQVISFAADAPTWQNVVAMETALQSSNVQNTDDTFGYVTSPLVNGVWKTTPKASGTAEFIVDRDGKVNTHRMLASNQLANTGVGSAILGKWSECYILLYNSVDIVSDIFSGASQNVVIVTVTVIVDVVLAHANAFVLSSG